MQPVIILDTSRIRPGRAAEVRMAFNRLTRFVEVNEPRALVYAVSVDEEQSVVTVFQVHPDSASAEYHMDVGAEEFKRFMELLDLDVIHVYGDPSGELLTRLRRKADMLGGSGVVVHELHAGFARLAQDDALA